MAFLTPDRVRVERIGRHTITIKEKIIPDGARATKDIASHIKKGDLVKPNKKLNNGTGKPKGVTVHNTADITPAKGTNAAEQYARATYPNGNMGGVAVHFWVWKNEIWQQLREDERGWHAADGSRRRKDHRGGQTGGNVDTIAIECIGKDPESEDTTAKLVAYLCKKHGLDPAYDVYTHNYWMHGVDKIVQGVRKNCPLYILPHWNKFLDKVKEYYNEKVEPETKPKTNTLYRVQTGAFKHKSNADALLNRLKKDGFDTYMVQADGLYKVQVGAYAIRENAEAMAKRLKDKGFSAYITTESGSPVAAESANPAPKPSEPTKSAPKKTWQYYISGSLVKELQREINKQFNKKIKVDGYFGNETISALPVVRPGAEGNLTKIIQKRLIELGYSVGKWGADGKFGNATYSAVVKFQRDRKLKVDGIVGQETWKELFKK